MKLNKASFVIAVDIGTTSTKALLIDRAGHIVANHSVGYPLYTPMPNMAEQNPDDIYTAVIEAIRYVMDKSHIAPHDVRCVSFSAAMHSLLAVDKHNNPLTPSITFADNRSAAYVRELEADQLGSRIFRRTGTPIHPMSPLLKLMWLKEHKPHIFNTAYKFIGIKEYVFAKLFNRYVVDYSIASATGMFNLEQLMWDRLALDTIGIGAERLSELVSPTFVISGLDPSVAAQMGLAEQTPFVIGASDGTLANLGIGAIEPGIHAVTIGTSGAVRAVVRKPLIDPDGRLFCYCLTEDYWVVGGAINNGGVVLRWVKEQLATDEASEAQAQQLDPYDALMAIAEDVAPGADGLLFLPLLAGTRAPYWNANARGVFFGLTLYHEKKHMIRAAVEGVMFRIHSVLQVIEQLAGETKQIKGSGGFARSRLWCSMLADIAGTQVTVPDCIESSGLGAAKLGLLAMGDIDDFSEVSDWDQTQLHFEPNLTHRTTYEELFGIFTRVYEQLVHEFDAIASFQQLTENRK